jgi:hypothetical protein
MRADRFICAAFGFAILCGFAIPAVAGIYRTPGFYVAVYSTYHVSGSMSEGYESETYHGPIEGPFTTEPACMARVKELQVIQKTRSIADGSALFMCYQLDAPMKDDSGIWWNPQQPTR